MNQGGRPRDRNDRPGGGNAAGDVAPRRRNETGVCLFSRGKTNGHHIDASSSLVETISPEPVERMTRSGTVSAPGKTMIPAPPAARTRYAHQRCPTGRGERARLAQNSIG